MARVPRPTEVYMLQGGEEGVDINLNIVPCPVLRIRIQPLKVIKQERNIINSIIFVIHFFLNIGTGNQQILNKKKKW